MPSQSTSFAAYASKVDVDFKKRTTSVDQHFNKELEHEQAMADLASKAMRDVMCSAQGIFSEDHLVTAIGSVSTVVEQQERRQARSEAIKRSSDVMQKLVVLLDKHKKMSDVIDKNGFAEKLEETITAELEATENLHSTISSCFASMREAFVEQCVTKRRAFHARASEAVLQQKGSAVEMHGKIKHGIAILAHQLSQEKTAMSDLLNEELSQLKARTDRLLLANVDPAEASFKRHVDNVSETELRLKHLEVGDDSETDLDNLIADVGGKLNNQQQDAMLCTKRLADSDDGAAKKRQKGTWSQWIPSFLHKGGQ